MSRVIGHAKLREVEARLLKAGPDLTAQVARELGKVAPKVAKVIRAQAATHIPRRMGYAGVLADAMEFRAVVKTGKGMTMTVWANGKRERRDLTAIERGVLRHPLFGNRKRWYAQTEGVTKGLVSDGVDKATPLIVKAVEKGRDTAADNIVR